MTRNDTSFITTENIIVCIKSRLKQLGNSRDCTELQEPELETRLCRIPHDCKTVETPLHRNLSQFLQSSFPPAHCSLTGGGKFSCADRVVFSANRVLSNAMHRHRATLKETREFVSARQKSDIPRERVTRLKYVTIFYLNYDVLDDGQPLQLSRLSESQKSRVSKFMCSIEKRERNRERERDM